MIASHAAELADAERLVNDVYFAWRAGRSTPFDDGLDAMLRRWRELGDGEVIVVEWPSRVAARRR